MMQSQLRIQSSSGQDRLLTNPVSGPLHLASVSTDEYAVLSHPHFPGHRVRVKQTEFCDTTVK
jgi:hypothetical protein